MPKVSKKNTRRKMKGGGVPEHEKARSKHPAYPDRLPVSLEKAPWTVPWPDYAPTHFEHEVLAKNVRGGPGGGWADPDNPDLIREEVEKRITYHPDGTARTLKVAGFIQDDGIPRYPIGRTGMTGRGLLGKWGPNHAADPIVTRVHPNKGLQIVAIQRKDTLEWALPGGMVDAGESASQAAKREFEEEAAAFENEADKISFKKMTEYLFSNGEMVYRGCVDDPRNTDNAWMETTAFHFHCSPQLGMMMQRLEAGDDAEPGTAIWLTVNDGDPRYTNLYASHRSWVEDVKINLIKTGVITCSCAPSNPPPPHHRLGRRPPQPAPAM